MLNGSTTLGDRIPEFHKITEVPLDMATEDQFSMLYTRYSLAARYGAGKDVLEVACGTGLGLGMVARDARRVLAGDIDQQNYTTARETYRDNPKIEVRRFAAEAIPLPPASFDVVILFEALYYLRSADVFFREAKRLLRPGGLLLISSVNCRWSGFNPSPFSTRYYDVAEIAEALTGLGFGVSMYGGFTDETAGVVDMTTHVLRKAAISLGLIPRTMKSKEWLKRIFYGKLKRIPYELQQNGTSPAALDTLAWPVESDLYRMIYCVASLGNSPSNHAENGSAAERHETAEVTKRDSLVTSVAFTEKQDSVLSGNRGESNPRPFVSVVMPCYNEREHIEHCLDSILANPYPPDRWEILIIDGMSSDGTREILTRYAANHPQLRMIDNPARSKPRAMNLAIEASKGDLVLRADCHAVYPPNYIESLVATLQRTGVEAVGALRETISSGGPVAQAIAVALSNRFTVGNAHYRTGASAERLVDTIWCGCYRRDVFARVGPFNEALTRAQDREFNFRLSLAGGKMLLDPLIKAAYFPRTSFRAYVKWMYEGAYWLFVAPVHTKVPLLRWRNWVPILFFGYNVFALAAAALAPQYALGFAAPLVFYLLVTALVSTNVAWQRRSPMLAGALMVVMVATHYAYALGAVHGWLASIFRNHESAFQPQGGVKQ